MTPQDTIKLSFLMPGGARVLFGLERNLVLCPDSLVIGICGVV